MTLSIILSRTIQALAVLCVGILGVFVWIVADGTAQAIIEAGEVIAGPDRFGPDGIAEILEGE